MDNDIQNLGNLKSPKIGPLIEITPHAFVFIVKLWVTILFLIYSATLGNQRVPSYFNVASNLFLI